MKHGIDTFGLATNTTTMPTLRLPLALLALIAHNAMAQTDPAQWVLLSNDSGATFQGREDLVREASGGLLACFSQADSSTTTRLRYVRMDATMLPLAQWDIDADTMEVQLKRMVPLADGSTACFGRYEGQAFYLLLDPNGEPTVAKTYTPTSGGGIWNDAVEDGANGFMVGGQRSPGSQGARARIAADGSVQGSELYTVGGDLTPFHSMHRTADGGYLYTSGVNAFGPEGRIKVVRADSAGTLTWARTYVDSLAAHSFADVFELGDGTLRVITRYQSTTRAGLSMLALTGDGDVLWARKRLSLPPHSFLTHVAAETAMLGDSAFLVFGEDANDAPFVHIVDTESATLALGFPQLPVSQLVKAVHGDAHDVYLMGTGPGLTLNSGTVAMLMIHAGTELSFCTADPFTTNQGAWIPRVDTAYTTDTATWVVTDVLPTITMQPGTATVEVSCVSTAVAPPDVQVSFALTPNPAKEEVRITGTHLLRVELVDAMGRIVLSQQFSRTSSLTVDLHALSPGLYHARAWDGTQWWSGPLVKE